MIPHTPVPYSTKRLPGPYSRPVRRMPSATSPTASSQLIRSNFPLPRSPSRRIG